ncbi:U-box domain-containing protein 5 isoform X2 [Silene latifolia]|uniref:U-box domain-containing protein 5 isoform X2 n=1 Tax=Silene latifolia TaxID=37657 RepID=UPI003D76BDA1
MGSDASEVQETRSLLCSVKAHLRICKQLLRIVEKISCIIPKIEAARPGSSQGMEALCVLRKANERAKEHVQYCDSSKLYLAVIGDEMVKRIERTRTLMVQSLSKLQNMVLVDLGSKISELVVELRDVNFCVDSNEALAGKTLKALLEGDVSPVSSVGNSEIEMLQFAASALHISSKKDLLIERRSLKKLLGETKEKSSKKWKTLAIFLRLLKKYDNQVLQGQNGQNYFPTEFHRESMNPNPTDLDFLPSYALDGSQTSILQRPIPPEEFKCYLSSELMYDPVVISSGQTFERSYIQKWFDDGHDTCPKTDTKLSTLSVLPNNSMRDLILKWSVEYGINIPEPSLSTQDYGSLETSYNSISSSASASYMGDLQLRTDMSGLSIGSLDSSYTSISRKNTGDSLSKLREVSYVDSRHFQFYDSIDEIQRRFLSNVNELPWESQCKAVQDVNMFMIDNNPSCSFVSSENFLDPLLRFLQDAFDKHDVDAQKVGNQLLLTFLKASRTEISQLNSDVYTVLASFLATETMEETLSVIEVLSARENAIPRLASSGVLTSIIKLLDANNRDFQEGAIKILYNLSINIDASTCGLASDWIPKLVPFLEESEFGGTCIAILENLSKFDVTKDAIAETDGCMASIIKLLDPGSSSVDTQEHAVGLHHVSVNGTVKGKSSALEVLRQLRDPENETEQELAVQVLNDNTPEDHEDISENKSSKTSRLAGWKKKMFSKKK